MPHSEVARRGLHFLQIPGPANMPDRVLREMNRPLIDHRGPEFAKLTRSILERLQQIFQSTGPVIVYPASGHGAWEAALVNTLAPGDRILALEGGHFAAKWCDVATRLGLNVDRVSGDWRQGIDPAVIESKLAEDRDHRIKAIMMVHTETSTGVTSSVSDVRQVIDRAGHPALFLVDCVSSLGTTDYRHNDWGVDVSICASQKGLMLSPGLAFNALSDKALQASQQSTFPKAYWDWGPILSFNERGFFPYTPPTTLFFGLNAALDMLLEEGFDAVFARHARLAEATRQAVQTWGLEIQCANPQEYSNSITGIRLPEGHNADALRQVILEKFDLSLGKGLGKVEGEIFRIGHLGDFNELMLTATLSGVEMGLDLAGVPRAGNGVQAAMDFLKS